MTQLGHRCSCGAGRTMPRKPCTPNAEFTGKLNALLNRQLDRCVAALAQSLAAQVVAEVIDDGDLVIDYALKAPALECATQVVGAASTISSLSGAIASKPSALIRSALWPRSRTIRNPIGRGIDENTNHG
jgi:hypothetical protein